MISASMDPRVRAIREHPDLGEDSMSDFEENWSDEELLRALDKDIVATPTAAIQWALEKQDAIHGHTCEMDLEGHFPVSAIMGGGPSLLGGTEAEGGWGPYEQHQSEEHHHYMMGERDYLGDSPQVVGELDWHGHSGGVRRFQVDEY